MDLYIDQAKPEGGSQEDSTRSELMDEKICWHLFFCELNENLDLQIFCEPYLLRKVKHTQLRYIRNSETNTLEIELNGLNDLEDC